MPRTVFRSTYGMNGISAAIQPMTSQLKDIRSSFISRITAQKIINLLFVLALTAMSLFQSIKILNEYLEFRVIKITDISNEIPLQMIAPAITFCLNDFLSFSVVKELFPEAIKEFKEIQEKIENTDDSTVHFEENLRLEKLIKYYQIRAINQMTVNEAFDRSLRVRHYIDNCLVVRQNNISKCEFDLKEPVRYLQDSQKCFTLLYDNSGSNQLNLSYGDRLVFIFGRKNLPEFSISGLLLCRQMK